MSSAANILDLVLTTPHDLVGPITYLPDLSDHLILHFLFNIPKNNPAKTVKRIRDYARADSNGMNRELFMFGDS